MVACLSGGVVYFDDGTNPSMEMCREFIDLSDRIISAGGESLLLSLCRQNTECLEPELIF